MNRMTPERIAGLREKWSFVPPGSLLHEAATDTLACLDEVEHLHKKLESAQTIIEGLAEKSPGEP